MTNPNFIENLSTEKLADVLTFVPGLEQIKVVNRLYDGTRHVQTIGISSRYANVEIMVFRETLEAMNMAEARADLLRLVYREVAYLGYIDSPIDWNPVIDGTAYKSKIKFLIEG